MKGWHIALIVLLLIIFIGIVTMRLLGVGCSCAGNCKCKVQCNCAGNCKCGRRKEGFVDEMSGSLTAATVYDACAASTVKQSSYVTNICAIYKNMVQPLLEAVRDDLVTYNKIVKAYNDTIVTNIVPRAGQSYTQQYPDMLNAFIAFEKTAFNIYSAADKSIPDGYAFIVPDPIAIVDYAPGVASWEPPALQPKSYKCSELTQVEQDALNKLTTRLNRGSSTTNQQLYQKAQKNICVSKGYYFNDGALSDKGCAENCEGCCMPSSEELPGVGNTASVAPCPKPKVRPFQIPPRQIKLRLVTPSIQKAITECFSNEHVRDLQQLYKAEKLLSLKMT